MSNIVQSVQNMGEMVGNGMKNLIDLAEGYIYEDGSGANEPRSASQPEDIARDITRQSDSGSPAPLDSISNHSAAASSVSASSFSTRSLPPTDELIQTMDVTSGWIHIPAAYLDDGGGGRVVKSFGLRNLVNSEVAVEVGSDMRDQVSFWIGEDESPLDSNKSSASSTSSSPSSALGTTLPPYATCTIYLAFQPSGQSMSASLQSLSSEIDATPRVHPSDATPRVHPSQPRNQASDSLISPPPSISSLSRISTSENSSNSVSGSVKSSAPSVGNRKTEPIHRAFSVHGSISIRASSTIEVMTETEHAPSSGPTTVLSRQSLSIPLFATVCRSLFTAALIDPSSGRTSGTQLSLGRLEVDFGADSIIGGEYYRDILLVNRSEVELVWSTAVVNARSKDAVWFSLRDLDSENVFGVDTSAQPVPLPPLSSRHLRLELRVRKPMTDFDFDFLISNVNQPGNVVTCHAIGSGITEASDNTLKILSETSIDFGQICDGMWSKKVVTCKNTGDKPLDVKFSATPGYDVVFRLAGVAGDDMDEELPSNNRSVRSVSGTGSTLDKRAQSIEAKRGRELSASRKSSRGVSPSSSTGRDSSSIGDDSSPSLQAQLTADLSRHLISLNNRTSRSVPSASDRASSGREPSLPPSRGLSRVTSRNSSHLHPTSGAESDEEDDQDTAFMSGNGGECLETTSNERSGLNESTADKAMPNQIEEVTMRPGTEYRILLLYRSARITDQPAEVAGQMRESSWKVYLDSTSSRPASNSRRTLKCTAMSCTSLISISSGSTLDFGEVTVGASKTGSISIKNLSALSARVEIAAISKVLSANRNVIVIPPWEEVEERIEFFPRRINERYEKQIFVRNLLNRANDQLLEIRSKNVDVYNLTIHSHLYRILTPSGSNFLDFGSVIINAPTIRTVSFENLTASALLLELVASQPEDVELFVKAEDAPAGNKSEPGKYAETSGGPERAISPPNGELKERFMETMRELSVKTDGSAAKSKAVKAKGTKAKEKTEQAGEDAPKLSIGASMMVALRKGGRGKPVQLYGNAVVYKDRNLLEDHEYLDLAAGPPVAAHRSSPRSKRTALLDTIELEDKSKLSGQHPRVPKLDFAASAKAIGLFSKDARMKKTKPSQPALVKPIPTHAMAADSSITSRGTEATCAHPPAHTSNVTPESLAPSPVLFASTNEPPPSLASVMNAMNNLSTADNGPSKSPALTAKRVEPKEVAGSDVSKMTVDELLVAIEQQDSQKSSITHSTLEEEEAYVRRTMALRKELQNLINAEKLVPARSLSVAAQSSCKLIVIMTPNGSTRPHISTRAKRADSRIFIKLAEFDRTLLSNASASTELGELPVRDLVIRSSCVRSVLEVGQSSINFGGCEKGEVKSKTIVVQNKSDCIGMFRLRTSGSIASGDLKLGMGRYGVIAAFGRKEVEQFSFTPSLTGNYNETLTVENVLDGYNDQKVSVKAVVRKQPAMTVDMTCLDFGTVNLGKSKTPVESGFVITNVSKHERVFVIEVTPPTGNSPFAEISLAADEKGGGIALSKGEEEEVETILQKLKIARRKQKADKIKKYESRLAELGVTQTGAQDSDADSNADGEDEGDVPSVVGTPAEEKKLKLGEETCVTSLSVTLGPSQKIKVFARLVASANLGNGVGAPIDAVITVHERKNTDETISVVVKATEMDDEVGTASVTSTHSQPCQEPLHRQIMLHCLKLTLQCPVSQTAFCVGSTLFLPDTSPHYTALRPYFTPFPLDDPDPFGLILADGWSRQIPGNTHAEANALTNFRTRYAELLKTGFSSASSSAASSSNPTPTLSNTLGSNDETPTQNVGVTASSFTSESSVASNANSTRTAIDLPPIEDVLHDSDCYATMEPCSVRTSGGPSCALELVRAKVRKVYLGVEEPPDFVQCEGVRILEDGGVEVGRVVGLEQNCLEAARRGRS